ncbi:c-type cytochrome biogenesis protein CcmI [Alphaproteobacteria bacterium]|nr:c-type cytochrome biogenesis protein CcmI [Alphaproteobacteria bacterium]
MYLIPLIIFCFVAVLVLLIPYYKKAVVTEQRKPDISVYTEQLKELENNFKLDLLSEVEAKRSRIEIERRILSVASNEEGVIIEEAPNSFFIISMLMFLLMSIALYSVLGTPSMPDYPRSLAEKARLEGDQAEDYKTKIKLRERLVTQLASKAPDIEGLVYLSRLEMSLGNFQSAAKALYQAQVIDPKSFDLQLMYGESLIVAAKEKVTPAALVVLNKAAKTQPTHPGPKYYFALADYQAGDIEVAYRNWLEISRGLEEQSPLKPLVDYWADKAAMELGLVQGLPEIRAPSITSEQVETIQNMDEGEQAELIYQMVLQLADKQTQNPDNIEGWLRLSRAYMVLGQKPDAITAMKSALTNAPKEQQEIIRKELDKLIKSP